MLTGGADLSAFRDNPVALLNHDSWDMPVGRWENIRVEGDRILADVVFDEEDEKAATVMGKVERKFLKAASIGAWVIETSSDPSFMLPGQTMPTVTKWIVREASICTIGSNHNALALYDKDNNRIDLSDSGCLRKLFSARLSTGITHIKQQNMSKLSALLKLSDAASDDAVAGEVQRIITLGERLASENTALQKDKDALAARLKDFEAKETAAHKAESAALLDAAVRKGRINADGRPAWEKHFERDFEGAKAQLSSIPRASSVASQIQTGSAAGAKAGLSDMTFGEILKANLLKELKADNALYREKFFEAYGKYPA